MTGGRRQKHVCRLVACASLVAVSLLPDIASGPMAAAAPAVTSVAAVSTGKASVSVTLNTITPAVSVPRAPTTISGTVRNTGAVAIAEPIVRLLLGQRGLPSRGTVSDWATSGTGSSTDEQLTEVARKSLPTGLAPGAGAAFTLVVPATSISHRESFAVLPVSVDVAGTTAEGTVSVGSQHTFLPALSSTKAYQPVSIAWLVPLTLDPDPALQGIDSPARVSAWTKAIGTGSRLDRLITGTDTTKVTWAIDPAILGPPPAPAAVDTPTTPSTQPTPSTTATGGGATTPDPVTEATTALASRLRAAAPRHTLWSLPYADPDLATLLALAPADPTLNALITRPSALDIAVGTARADIAWPVNGTLTSVREQKLRKAFASRPLAAAVVSASTQTTRSGYTDNASRKSSGGLPLLSYDQALSRTFAQMSAQTSGAITIQRFLADSMALLGELPGTPDRSVLVAAPRAFAGDPTVLGAFFLAVSKAPWLAPTTTDQLLIASEAETPEQSGVGMTVAPTSPSSPTTKGTTSKAAPDPLSPGTSRLTAARLLAISHATSTITGLASIRDDAEQFRIRWTDAQAQLLSVRWRGHAQGAAAIDAATQAAITSVSRGVRVAPSSVNFFADQGVLTITIINDLAVPVHDVHLTLTPGQPRLRIEQQAGPLRIGAKSRTNVRFDVTAIAAGVVPVEAVLTTANGTPLGQNASVNVRVQPTSTWIYRVLGGLAGVILVLGVYRSLRRGTRASRPARTGDPR